MKPGSDIRWCFRRCIVPVLVVIGCAHYGIIVMAADNLVQVNPIKKAPTASTAINTDDRRDGYPVFSDDGKLFLFTRDVGTKICTTGRCDNDASGANACAATRERVAPCLDGRANWDVYITGYCFLQETTNW
jgi:hypothetical protein